MPNEAMKKLQPFFEKKERLGHLLGLLSFDVETTAPEKTIEAENDLLSFYGAEYAAINKDPEFIALVKQAKEQGNLNDAETLLIDDLLFDISVMEKIPMEKYIEWSKAESKCEEMWKKAKAAADWGIVEPYFKKVVEIYREKSELYRLPFHKTPYDSFLSLYEKGQTEEDVNLIFEPLKRFLVGNLDKVLEKQSHWAPEKILPHSQDDQARLSIDLLKAIQYDLSRGVLRETEHPFSNNIARDDCRVTTHYYENDWRSSMFSVIHEGGHSIQFQNWPDYQFENHVDGRASAALCETHSRFYENIIGRSHCFAPTLLKLCQKDLGGEFLDMDEETFYRFINRVKRSLIRTDSDEYTYCLHIILRYELERDLINAKLEVEDLPKAWNQKYEEFLGVVPPNDSLGVMQDTHWFGGAFGYFPSYALGNLYGAQILHYMKKDLPFDELLAKGDLTPILTWLREKDFAYDYLDPKEWILKVTGESMNPEYFMEYLSEKYL
ncbi:MAG: carboxypeptidase M32 [Bacilli bacterium]|nr:carboxypeptidase M32 [Bacilli bacterium]